MEKKFRIWNSKKNQMQQASASSVNWSHGEILAGANDLMQFTGIFDKNNLEIYEKDIIINGKVNGEDYMEKVNLMELIHQHIEVGFGDNLEVIGNIYENPELLKLLI